MDSPSWREGFNKDVSTWLNARGWQDEPPAAKVMPRSSIPLDDSMARATERKLAASRVEPEKLPTMSELEGLRKLRG